MELCWAGRLGRSSLQGKLRPEALAQRTPGSAPRWGSGSSLIMMVQAAKVGNGNDPPSTGWVELSWHGRIALQREMGSHAVVVGDVLLENQPQMPFAEDNHVVQAFTAD